MKKPLRWLLVGGGLIVAISGAVNIASAIALIDPSAERELGVTRNSLLVQYGLLLVAGSAMVFFGLRRRK